MLCSLLHYNTIAECGTQAKVRKDTYSKNLSNCSLLYLPTATLGILGLAPKRLEIQTASQLRVCRCEEPCLSPFQAGTSLRQGTWLCSRRPGVRAIDPLTLAPVSQNVPIVRWLLEHRPGSLDLSPLVRCLEEWPVRSCQFMVPEAWRLSSSWPCDLSHICLYLLLSSSPGEKKKKEKRKAIPREMCSRGGQESSPWHHGPPGQGKNNMPQRGICGKLSLF